MRVTVVTPTFNLLKSKRVDSFYKCIASVQSQTLAGIEHFVVDGKSTDGTIEILKELEERGLIRFISESDKGIYDAFNKGFQYAKGEYVCYLGSDDYFLHEDSVANLFNAIEANNASWAYGNTYYKRDGLLYPWYGDLDHIPYGSCPCHQSILVSVKVMNEIGGFEITNACADLDVMFKLVSRNYKSVAVDSFISIFAGGGWSTVNAALIENDSISSFYKHFGKSLGLTLKECEQLYARRYKTLPIDEQYVLMVKLVKESWMNCFIKNDFLLEIGSGLDIINKMSNKLYRLDSRVPHRWLYKLFGIRVLKVVDIGNDKRKIYLFGIPTMEVRAKDFL